MRMFTDRGLRLSRQRAFTLIEILVIAALISLFSTLAIFSIQYLVNSSKRKAAVLDTRTIAHSLAMVKMDFGLFPKIGYLSFPRGELLENSDSNVGANVYQLPPDFDTLGVLEYSEPNRKEGGSARNILSSWSGPYLPSSRGRSLIATGGVGFTVRMRMPTAPQNRPLTLDWPADPWGNPYVVYLVRLEYDAPSNTYIKNWISSISQEADYQAIVVSYGPNRIPGGYEDRRRINPDQVSRADDFMLYRKDGTEFIALKYEELFQSNSGAPLLRLAALRNDFVAYREAMGDRDFPGILDDGSDDLYCQIPSK